MSEGEKNKQSQKTPFYKIPYFVEASKEDICFLIDYAHRHQAQDIESLLAVNEDELRESLSTEVFSVYQQLKIRFTRAKIRKPSPSHLEQKVEQTLVSAPVSEPAPTNYPERVTNPEPPNPTSIPSEQLSPEPSSEKRQIRGYKIEWGPGKQYIMANGVKVEPGRPFNSQRSVDYLERAYQIYTLYSEGKSPAEISKTVGVSSSNVIVHLKKIGVLKSKKFEAYMPAMLSEPKVRIEGVNPAPPINPLSEMYT